MLARDGTNNAIKERLWKRAQQGKASPADLLTAVVTSDVEWVRAGVNMRVKTLRGEPTLRHASMNVFGKNEQARGSDFLYHWISDRLPDDAIVDPVLLVIDLAVDAKREAET